MRRLARLACCIWLALAAGGAHAEPVAMPVAVDVNIVTALDISDSVSTTTHRAQIAALAAAVRKPEILAAIAAGRHGRIGMAVFVWHQYRFEVLPWRVIGSPSEAEAAARAIETRIPVNLDRELRSEGYRNIGRLTDLSGALDAAGRSLDAAPFASASEVVNVIGNGADNYGAAAQPSRDRLLGRGVTVNGVVFGDDPEAAAYFRSQVIGGNGAFLMEWRDGPLTELMVAKLAHDLLAALEPGPGRDGITPRAGADGADSGPRAGGRSRRPGK